MTSASSSPFSPSARSSRSSALRPASRALAALVVAAAALSACAPQDAKSDGATASGAPGTAGGAAACAPGALATRTAGTLTVGTDKPAYDPWFTEDKPENGKGFESAVAYAVAEKLGYPKEKVTWVVAPFGKATAPGAKDFDFDINQVSISDERKQAVDFSPGYYDVRQAVIALKNSKAANARSIADLKGAKLGAQVGTTSLDTITNTIKPSSQPAVFDSNDLAKAALKNGQVEALVVDLPTAFYITGAEVPEAQVVGQFEGGSKSEQFGLVLDKGSRLTGCVSQAVDPLRSDGTLAKLEKQWLSDAVSAPVLK